MIWLLFNKNRSKLVSFPTHHQRGGDLPLPSRRRQQGHAGHPLCDEMRPWIPTAGEQLDPVPGQPALVWNCLLPASVEVDILRNSVRVNLAMFKSHEKHQTNSNWIFMWGVFTASGLFMGFVDNSTNSPPDYILWLFMPLIWHTVCLCGDIRQRCVALCCPSSRTADIPAAKASSWTPGATSPATPAIVSRGNTRAPVSTGDPGTGCSQFVQVLDGSSNKKDPV